MIQALRTAEDRRWYHLSLGALIVAAWAALAVWGASPYAPLLDHGGALEGAAGPLPRLAALLVALAAGPALVTAALALRRARPVSALRDEVTQ